MNDQQLREVLHGAIAFQFGKIRLMELQEVAVSWASGDSGSLAGTLKTSGLVQPPYDRLIDATVQGAIDSAEGDVQKAIDHIGGLHAVLDEYYQGALLLDAQGELLPGRVTAADPDQVPAVPEHTGRYNDLQEHSSGGMGKILLVHDRHLGRDVALKELLPDQLRGKGTRSGVPTAELLTMPVVARFMQEARITGSLEHPSIVPVYEVGYRPDGTLYYTMKLVRGTTFQDAIVKCKDLRDRLKLLPHFLDLCHAIAYAHSRGVIHRDIKPLNVMVGEFGETIVIDWGIAKVKGKADPVPHGAEHSGQAVSGGSGDSTAKTLYGEALGSPYFMAPEQAQGQIDRIDERSDVYALGAMLYTLLTGQVPYLGLSPQEFLLKVTQEPPRPIAESVKDAPAELVAIAERAMNRDPEKRYPSAKEITEDVANFLSGGLVQAYNYRFSEHLGRFLKKNRAAVTAATFAVLALLAFGAYSYISILNERTEALNERNKADQARAFEEQERQRAEEALAVAETERARAEAERSRAESASQDALRELYFANIALAERALRENRIAQARTILEACPPAFRNWEWGHLAHRANLARMTIKAGGREVEFVNGNQLLLASANGTISLVNENTGETNETIAENLGASYVLDVSDDGTCAALLQTDGLYVYNLAPFQQLARIERIDVTDVALSAIGTFVAYRFQEEFIDVRRVSDGLSAFTFRIGESTAAAFAFSPTSPEFVLTYSRPSGDSRAGTALVRNLETEETLFETTLAEGVEFTGAAFSPDGGMLALSSDRDVTLWATDIWKEMGTIPVRPGRDSAMVFSPNGGVFVCGDGQGRVGVWRASPDPRESAVDVLDAHTGAVHAVAFAGNDFVLTAGADAIVRVWNAATMDPATAYPGHTAAIFDLATSGPRGEIASTGFDGTTRCWPAGETLQFATGVYTNGAISRTRVIVAARPSNATGAEVWDLAQGRRLSAFEVDGESMHHMAVSGDGQTVAFVGERPPADASVAAIHVFPAMGGDAVTIELPQTPSEVRLNHDGAYLAARTADEVLLYAVGSEAPLLTIAEGAAVAFSPAGAWAAVALRSGEVRAIDLTNGTTLRTIASEAPFGTTLQFSDDGQRLFVSTDPLIDNSYKGHILVVPMDETKETLTLAQHDGHVSAIAHLAEGDLLATGSRDRRIKLWNLKTGEETATLRGHGGEVLSLAFSEDGARLFSASADGTFKVWDAPLAREIMTVFDTSDEGIDAKPSEVAAYPGGTVVLATTPALSGDVVYPAIPWRSGELPGNEDTPLAEQIEAYRRTQQR